MTFCKLIFHNEQLKFFKVLKRWRLEESRKQQVLPYIIFHDVVLKDIVLK